MSKITVELDCEGVSKEELLYDLKMHVADCLYGGYTEGELVITHTGKNFHDYEKSGWWTSKFEEDE